MQTLDFTLMTLEPGGATGSFGRLQPGTRITGPARFLQQSVSLYSIRQVRELEPGRSWRKRGHERLPVRFLRGLAEANIRANTRQVSIGEPGIFHAHRTGRSHQDLRARHGAPSGLSLMIPEGAIGLLGPNGAGKTTMIRSLLGLIALDAGRGRVLGMDIRYASDGHSPGGRVRSRRRVPVSRRGRRPVRGLRRRARGHAVRVTPCSGPTRCSTTLGWERSGTGGSSRTRRA